MWFCGLAAVAGIGIRRGPQRSSERCGVSFSSGQVGRVLLIKGRSLRTCLELEGRGSLPTTGSLAHCRFPRWEGKGGNDELGLEGAHFVPLTAKYARVFLTPNEKARG